MMACSVGSAVEFPKPTKSNIVEKVLENGTLNGPTETAIKETTNVATPSSAAPKYRRFVTDGPVIFLRTLFNSFSSKKNPDFPAKV